MCLPTSTNQSLMEWSKEVGDILVERGRRERGQWRGRGGRDSLVVSREGLVDASRD